MEKLNINILDSNKNLIVSFDSNSTDESNNQKLVVKKGMNQFVWNMRYPGPTSLEENKDAKVEKTDANKTEKSGDGELKKAPVVPGVSNFLNMKTKKNYVQAVTRRLRDEDLYIRNIPYTKIINQY